MKNGPEPRKPSRLPRWVRMLIYLPLVVVILFFVLRRLEHMATYNPGPYVPGPNWTLPPNGEEVWVKVATNGDRVHGWFLRAMERPAIATVLHCHGNTGNLSDVVWVAQELTARGFDMMIFDYRGYGRSEGRLTDEWGLYADAEAVYNHLVRERGVNAENSRCTANRSGRPRRSISRRASCAALIVESGLSSASDMGVVSFPWLPRQLHFLSKNRFESARKIADVKCPALITHGTNDAVIPVDQGRKLSSRPAIRSVWS